MVAMASALLSSPFELKAQVDESLNGFTNENIF